jgi:L-lactate dehydrogenase complex protein LldE
VDLMRPSVGFAAARLLEDAGFSVEVPAALTCCAQPAYNSGDDDGARAIARQVIEALRGYRYVVLPSGSCAGTVVVHYPRLFAEDGEWREAARDLAERTFELTRFLDEVAPSRSPVSVRAAAVTYHDGCSGLRELVVREQPRRLLQTLHGLELREMADTEVCCGFGGTFCVKYPEISGRMAADKVARIRATGASVLLAGELGCLLHLAGLMLREGVPVRAFHIAEMLAGMDEGAAIGEGRER